MTQNSSSKFLFLMIKFFFFEYTSYLNFFLPNSNILGRLNYYKKWLITKSKKCEKVRYAEISQTFLTILFILTFPHPKSAFSRACKGLGKCSLLNPYSVLWWGRWMACILATGYHLIF